MITYGTPAAQGSKKAWAAKSKGRYTGKVIMMEQSKGRLDPWRAAVAAQARKTMAGRPALTGAVSVGLVLYLNRGKSVRRPFPAVGGAGSGDLDKLARAVGDALTTAGVYADDSLVVNYHRLSKLYAGGPYLPGCPELDRPGCWISVRSLEADVPAPRIAPLYGHPAEDDLRRLRAASLDPFG